MTLNVSCGFAESIGYRRDVRNTPNDPKLSDCGGRRSLCGKVAGGERSEAAGAQAVTPGAVRCSAWLGVAVEFMR